ncbi:PTS system IIB component, Glc family /PTS system IIC component, Glc family [Ignavigranum ruoffiae]|uniref:PTS system IIB component, Glc family /PTS system IIC component, Glc family n=1 Tax=Ignavigranum ruoffiae TaxID=89093 RepID=A0A1H9B7A8_9LACT|nr:PTS transporter subunit EIIC [Ignavigranum ruoffiae]SEP84705.1 PTS system IIB component, Glc family /PTS system IIC component, Glc family [Ignavigranum ruoffiae]
MSQNRKSRLKDNIQTFGRSLLLPIALLAPIGMIMGIANALTQSYMIEKMAFLDNNIVQTILSSLKSISQILFNNIPLLFAMGVANGVAKKEKGLAVFAAVASYLILNVTMNVYLQITDTLADPEIASQVGQGQVLGIDTLKIESLGGIISGLLAAKVCDRFYKVEFPLAFAFFGGKKSVPIITSLLTIPIALIIPVFWNILNHFLMSISFIFLNKTFGHATYYTLNRALIPFGLHHVLSSTVRFTEVGGIYNINGQNYIGVLNALNEVLFNLGPNSPYWDQLMPKLTGYIAVPQMLTTLFRFPAIGLAMYHTANAKNKKIAKAVIITCVMTAFLGNITEPLEFTFLFIAPQLFGIYLLLSFIMTIPISFLNISIGYIRGTIFDFGIFGLMYENTHWIQLIILGIVNFIVFYYAFKYFIKKWDLETPGREKFDLSESSSELLKSRNYKEMARITIEGLGGRTNIQSVENCISRLRIDLNDPKKVDKEHLRKSGCTGIFFPSEKHIHVVFGPHVEFVRNAVDDLLDEK